MAFEQLGLNLIVRGASQFARDIGWVNTSLIRYMSAMRGYENQLLKVAQVEQRVANQRVATALRWYQTSQQNLTRLEAMQVAYGKLGTQAPVGFLDKLDDAMVDAAAAQEELNNAVNDGVAANQHYNQIAGQSKGIVGALSQVFSVLTGGFAKNFTTGTAMGTMLAKLVPQAAALSLVLDATKFATDAVVYGFKIFMGGLQLVYNIVKKVVGVVLDLGKTLINWTWEGIKKVANAIWNFATAPFQWIINGLKNIGAALGNIVQIAIGMNLERVLWAIGQKLREVAGIALEAGIDFQLLQIRLRGLIQREMSEYMGVPFNESLEEATVRAKELSYWISNLGVKSIFSVEAIANIVTLGMAYDYDEEQTKKLTLATVTFATQMGLGNLEIQRIVENLGQMKAQGKMTGQELRDLARGAFVPVNRVFQTMAKMPSALKAIRAAVGKDVTDWIEIKELGAAGEIPVELFMEAFIEMVNTDFPNAIENAAASMEVLRSNITDFIQSVIGWRVVTPVMDVLSARMNKVLGVLLSVENRTRFEKIGAAFAKIFTNVMNFFDKRGPDMIKIINGIIQGIMLVVRLVSYLTEGDFLHAMLETYMPDYADVPDRLKESLQGLVKWVQDNQGEIEAFFKDPIGYIKEHAIPAIQKLATDGFEFLKTKAGEALGLIKDWWDNNGGSIVGWIQNQLQGALQGVSKFISDNFGTNNPLYAFLELIKKIITMVAGQLTPNAKPEQPESWGQSVDPFRLIYGQKGVESSSNLNAVAAAFDNLKASISKFVDEALTKLGDWLRVNMPGYEGFKEIWTALSDGFKTLEGPFGRFTQMIGGPEYGEGGNFKRFIDTLSLLIAKVVTPGIEAGFKVLGAFFDGLAFTLGIIKGVVNDPGFQKFLWLIENIASGAWWDTNKQVTAPPGAGVLSGMVQEFDPMNQTSNAFKIVLNAGQLRTDTMDVLNKIGVDPLTNRPINPIIDIPDLFDPTKAGSPAKLIVDNSTRLKEDVVAEFVHMDELLVRHSIVPDMMTAIYNSIVGGVDSVLAILPTKVDRLISELQRAIDKLNEFIRKAAEAGAGGGGGGSGISSEWTAYQTGGSFRIPPGFERDTWPLGGGHYGSSGELITVTPSSMSSVNNITHNNNYNLQVSSGLSVKNIVSQYDLIKALVA